MQWISVEDRLPKDMLTVLICDENGDMVTAFLDTSGWHPYDDLCVGSDRDRSIVDSEITHWMPLPEPPETT